jgi:hypothetical protein
LRGFLFFSPSANLSVVVSVGQCRRGGRDRSVRRALYFLAQPHIFARWSANANPDRASGWTID